MNHGRTAHNGGAGGWSRAHVRPTFVFGMLAVLALAAAYRSGHTSEIAQRFVEAIATMTPIDALEWTGSLLGLFGAYLLATHSQFSRYGWYFFLSANVAMILFAYSIDRYGLLTQQIGFLGTSLLGLKRAGMLRFPVTP